MPKTIKILNSLGGQQVTPTFTFDLPVKSGTAASIKAGYLVIKDGSNPGYWKAAPDATDNDTVISSGVATGDSTETASADGKVTIETASVLVVSIKAKTPASLAATQRGQAYILDVTSGDYTFDHATSTKGIFRMISFDNTTDGNVIATVDTGWKNNAS